MKNAKRLIPHPPTPPTPPTPPKAPAPPVRPESPGSSSSSPKMVAGGLPGPLSGLLAQLGKGAGEGAPGKMPGMIAEIMKNVGRGKGPSAETIKRWIKEFPLDKYRDANGKVCCPVPKEYRDKLMKRLKGVD